MHALATLPLFTQDGDWDHHHHWWFVFPLFWISAIVLFWFLVGRRWRRDPRDSARQILAERYARDELSADEYRRRLDELARVR